MQLEASIHNKINCWSFGFAPNKVEMNDIDASQLIALSDLSIDMEAIIIISLILHYKIL